MSKIKLQVGDQLTEITDGEMIIFKITESRRSNTEFILDFEDPNYFYWSVGERWQNTRQILKNYRLLTEVEKLLYV